MQKLNDLSRPLTPLDPDRTLFRVSPALITGESGIGTFERSHIGESISAQSERADLLRKCLELPGLTLSSIRRKRKPQVNHRLQE